MDQEMFSIQDETNNPRELKDSGEVTSTGIPECAVCLQSCVHPVKLPCEHIFCYLCVKGVANQSKRCPMCRQEIPPDFLEKPQLVEIEDDHNETADTEYQWFYEGRNGWWQYDQRTSQELETAYKQGKRTCELLIAGFLYVADFGAMLQLRRNDHLRRRRIKRDLRNATRKGVAGLRLANQEQELVREIRGAERPASPASDTAGAGDESNIPVTPSNTPQTPAGSNASSVTTSFINEVDSRSETLHRVSEQMDTLLATQDYPYYDNSDNEEDYADFYEGPRYQGRHWF